MILTFDECLKKGMIKPFPRNSDNIRREMASAESDRLLAHETFSHDDYLWATVQAYYAMFHAARSVLFDAGYREKSHHCLGVFLEKLVDDARLDSRYLNYFSVVRDLREKANYDLSYSRENAETALKFADAFIEKMNSLIL
jgi:uncharacterized protein (UPF0332 family)